MKRREFLTATAALSLQALGPARAAFRTTSASERFSSHRKFAALACGRVAYTKLGGGEPALFIHAWPLNGYQWRDSIDLLSRNYMCIAPDMLGLGYSKPAGMEITPQSQVDMLVQLLDSLHVSRVHVVGNDSGGAVAQLFAAHHPERVRSLLLTNCDVGPDNPPLSFQPLVKAAKAGLLVDKFVKPQLADLTVARSSHGLGFAYSNPSFLTPEAVQTYLTPLVASPTRIAQFNNYTVSLGANALNAVEVELARLPAPARVVWGSADPFFSQSDPDYLARTLKNFRGVRRIPEGRLYFPEEMPNIIVDEARALWSVASSS